MTPEQITTAIKTLNPEQRQSVFEWLEYEADWYDFKASSLWERTWMEE